MFKVSLLPASYRKFLDGKKKKDLILRVAVIVLICMLIVYSGFAVRLFILRAQLKEIRNNNNVIIANVEELEQYKAIYDELNSSKQRVESILPKPVSAVKFMSIIQANRPEYASFSVLSVQDWSSNPICVIEGELPMAQNIGDAVSQLRDLEDLFKNGDDFKDLVTQVISTNSMPTIVRDLQGNESYSFRIYLSVGGNIVLDESGLLVTTTTKTTTTTTTTTNDPVEDTTESTTVAE
ncbi:MAG: hypothetical protein J6Q50_06670 [Clostridia bacterium]|nr:hypothetical protein [Clostridia bacterium]